MTQTRFKMISAEYCSSDGKNKVTKKPHDMAILFGIQLGKTYLGSQAARERKLNSKLSICQLQHAFRDS